VLIRSAKRVKTHPDRAQRNINIVPKTRHESQTFTVTGTVIQWQLQLKVGVNSFCVLITHALTHICNTHTQIKLNQR